MLGQGLPARANSKEGLGWNGSWLQEMDEVSNSNANGSIPDDHECAKG
jgi:hypothetical protein